MYSVHATAINLLPYIISCSDFSFISSAIVSKTGYFTAPSVIGSALAMIGASLLLTLTPTTPSSKWIGYQVLTGGGVGIAIQQGFVAVQAVLAAKDIPMGTSLITFYQSLGGATGVSIGDTVLLEILSRSNTNLPPGVSPQEVIGGGATAFRSMLSPDVLRPFLEVHNHAIRDVFILAVVGLGIGFCTSLGMEWRRLMKRDP